MSAVSGRYCERLIVVPRDGWIKRRMFRPRDSLHRRSRKAQTQMTISIVLLLTLTVLLAGYLFYALLYPENF